MFKNLKIVTRGYLLAGFVLAVLLIQAFLSNHYMGLVNQAVAYSQTHVIPTMDTASDLKTNIIQVQQWLTDISATRGQDGLDDGFTNAKQHYVLVKQELAELKRLLSEKSEHLRDMEKAFENYYSVGVKMANAYIEGGPASGNKMMAQFDDASSLLQDKAQALSDYIEQIKRESDLTIQAAVESSNQANFISIFIAISSIIMMVVMLKLWLVKPIDALKQVFTQLNQGSANLDFRFSDIDNSEVGDIKQEFNQFIAKLKSMADNILAKVDLIYHEIDKLDTSSVDLGKQAENLFAQVEQFSLAMNQMSDTSNSVASTTETTSTDVKQMETYLDNGFNAIHSTENSTQQVSLRIDQSAKVIAELESHTNEIVSMVDNIQSIAEQTNLLALNAAIEAARAGEQGRGFAVVADEVRSLASRTQESTVRINDIIQSLQSTTQSAVQSMNFCLADVAECVNNAKISQQAIAQTKQGASNVTGQVMSVAAAMEEQAMLVANNVRTIQSVHEQAAALENNVMNSANSAASLHKQAEDLKILARIFERN